MTSHSTIEVVLADDHNVVRQALRKLIDAEQDLKVVGEARDGIEAVNLVMDLQPDILVVDLMMPGLNGLAVTHQVRKRAPGTGVVVLSMHADDAYVLKALKSGASAYVLKDSDSTDLIRAIRRAADGRRFLSSPLSERAMDAYLQKAQSSYIAPFDLLTPREQEVLQMTAESLTSSEIAERLYISPRTVEKHRSNLMFKLGLHRQSEVVRYAVEHGIILSDGLSLEESEDDHSDP